jgi:phosphoglycerate dehydrogenase-like enzyme
VIEGAALDVYDEEPYEGTELLALDNLVMTPHFGGGTEHAQRRMTQLVRQNLDNHFRRQAGGLAGARAARHGG